jgi:hypothetical protein
LAEAGANELVEGGEAELISLSTPPVRDLQVQLRRGLAAVPNNVFGFNSRRA